MEYCVNVKGEKDIAMCDKPVYQHLILTHPKGNKKTGSGNRCVTGTSIFLLLSLLCNGC